MKIMVRNRVNFIVHGTKPPLHFVAPRRTAAFFVCAFFVSGCASTLHSVCTPEEQRAVNELIFFGTDAPAGPVKPGAWADFLSASVTPRFPQGLTFWQAAGQWQSADGTITREDAFVLNLLHPDDERSAASVQAIVAEYKSRFNQEAVLRVRSVACTSF